MKRILMTTIAILLALSLLAGCASRTTVVITTLPSAATATPSAAQSVTPSVIPTPFALPSPKTEPTPTPTPAIEPTPTPSPAEQIEIHKKNIPDIIEGDGRNLYNLFYEDGKYLYFIDWSAFEYCIEDRSDSICRVNMTTGDDVELLKHGSRGFCVEGGKIYWIEDDNKKKKSNIKQYDIKAKKNTLVYSAESYIYDIQAGNGRLYYIMCSNAGVYSVPDLYSMDINGGNNGKLLENVNSYILYDNNIIYTNNIYHTKNIPFTNEQFSYTSVHVYNMASKRMKVLDGKCGYSFCAAYGKIFFYEFEEGCVISIDIASGEKKILREITDDQPMVLGQYLFYIKSNGNNEELRAYDMTSGEYYYITSRDLPYLGVSNKNLYFYDDTAETIVYTVNLASLTIHNGKVSFKRLVELYVVP